MLLDQIFTPFLAESPLSVMARATVEHALAAAGLDQLFHQQAQTQYTRDLLFSSVVDLMSLVVTGVQPSISAAYQAAWSTSPFPSPPCTTSSKASRIRSPRNW